ncbi:MAG: aspartate carbamoyltransferase catalytic subunit [Clostridiales bacterium]|nr:aspartate carbamoyltransferase catalytic subunit [Clostridiales bacterium]
MKRKDILGIKDLTRAEINEILSTADVMRDMIDRGEKSNALRGKSVATLFCESSVRTRISFETAAKNLGASVSDLPLAMPSVQNGESLIDAGMTLDALKTDVIVLRHSVAGSCKLLAENVNASVINAGDGLNEHPSQALSDGLTARRHFGNVDGKRVVIVGDVKHSRVARSDAILFGMLGAKVTVCAPYSMLPCGIDGFGCDVETDFDKAILGADIIVPLRVGRKSMDGAYFSAQEYDEYYGVTQKRLELCSDDCIVMHFGSLNRGSEIRGDVSGDRSSMISEQVTNGVAVRMAMLDLLVNGDNKL